MTKLSEAKDRMFSFLYCPGEKAVHYYESESYVKCPEDLPDSQYLYDFNSSDHFDIFEEFIMELTLEIKNETVMKSLYLEFLEYIEHSFRDHFLKFEPFSNDKQRFINISSIVVDFLDWYLIEVGKFLLHSRSLLKKLIPPLVFKEHTLYDERRQPGGAIILVRKGNSTKAVNSKVGLRDILANGGDDVVEKLITHHGRFETRQKPEFWTNLLCRLYEKNLLKPNVQNKEIVAAINNTFNQDLRENNITNYSKFKEGNWTCSNRYEFSYL